MDGRAGAHRLSRHWLQHKPPLSRSVSMEAPYHDHEAVGQRPSLLQTETGHLLEHEVSKFAAGLAVQCWALWRVPGLVTMA